MAHALECRRMPRTGFSAPAEPGPARVCRPGAVSPTSRGADPRGGSRAAEDEEFLAAAIEPLIRSSEWVDGFADIAAITALAPAIASR